MSFNVSNKERNEKKGNVLFRISSRMAGKFSSFSWTLGIQSNEIWIFLHWVFVAGARGEFSILAFAVVSRSKIIIIQELCKISNLFLLETENIVFVSTKNKWFHMIAFKLNTLNLNIPFWEASFYAGSSSTLSS